MHAQIATQLFPSSWTEDPYLVEPVAINVMGPPLKVPSCHNRICHYKYCYRDASQTFPHLLKNGERGVKLMDIVDIATLKQ